MKKLFTILLMTLSTQQVFAKLGSYRQIARLSGTDANCPERAAMMSPWDQESSITQNRTSPAKGHEIKVTNRSNTR